MSFVAQSGIYLSSHRTEQTALQMTPHRSLSHASVPACSSHTPEDCNTLFLSDARLYDQRALTCQGRALGGKHLQKHIIVYTAGATVMSSQQACRVTRVHVSLKR